ncbi:MAG TPA: hypothetical protein VJM31_07320 [Vicinamibacterales bacterium]|nr:hypothetical protein [Vicinamibacterales bacterium]
MSPALEELETAAERLTPPLADIRRFTDLLFALDVSGLTDGNFIELEGMIDRAVRLLADAPDAPGRELMTRLLTAREGIEQGLAADPSKRPSREQARRIVAAHL